MKHGKCRNHILSMTSKENGNNPQVETREEELHKILGALTLLRLPHHTRPRGVFYWLVILWTSFQNRQLVCRRSGIDTCCLQADIDHAWDVDFFDGLLFALAAYLSPYLVNLFFVPANILARNAVAIPVSSWFSTAPMHNRILAVAHFLAAFSLSIRHGKQEHSQNQE